jgi:GT2 family glycosyltransferase
MESRPLISIIIPTRDTASSSGVKQLLEDISEQHTQMDVEVCQIHAVSPAGKARNIGAEKAKGDVLVFLDEDIRLGNKHVLSRLIETLLRDKKIGVVSASVRLRKETTKFERRYAKEIPHCEAPIVDRLLDVWVATSACCAARKDMFFKVGKFNEYIPRGQDPEFSYRVRKNGYRTVLVPQTWCYHPVPKNVKELVRLHFRNSKATAFVDKYYPELNIDLDPKGVIYPSEYRNRVYRGLRFAGSFFCACISGKSLLVTAKLTYILGYSYGILTNTILNIAGRDN